MEVVYANVNNFGSSNERKQFWRKKRKENNKTF